MSDNSQTYPQIFKRKKFVVHIDGKKWWAVTELRDVVQIKAPCGTIVEIDPKELHLLIDVCEQVLTKFKDRG